MVDATELRAGYFAPTEARDPQTAQAVTICPFRYEVEAQILRMRERNAPLPQRLTATQDVERELRRMLLHHAAECAACATFNDHLRRIEAEEHAKHGGERKIA